MVIQRERIVFQRDKMVIQRDGIVIHRDNSHGRVGADRDFGPQGKIQKQKQNRGFNKTLGLCWLQNQLWWDQDVPGVAGWIPSIPEQCGDRAEGSPGWVFVRVGHLRTTWMWHMGTRWPWQCQGRVELDGGRGFSNVNSMEHQQLPSVLPGNCSVIFQIF